MLTTQQFTYRQILAETHSEEKLEFTTDTGKVNPVSDYASSTKQSPPEKLDKLNKPQKDSRDGTPVYNSRHYLNLKTFKGPAVGGTDTEQSRQKLSKTNNVLSKEMAKMNQQQFPNEFKSPTITRTIEVKPARFTRPTSSRSDYYSNTSDLSTSDVPRFLQDGTQLIFSHPGVQNAFLSNLYALQMRGDMCDVLIRVEGIDFKCHKIVLAAACPYFSDLFKDNKSVRIDRLILEGLSSQSIEAMICYFYTARLIVDADDVEEVLESAYYLRMTDVVYLCIDYLDNNLNVHNCLSIYELAVRHYIQELRSKVFNYICLNFKSVAEEPRFQEISVDMLYQIISNTQVKVEAEEEVYLAVWSWYNFNRDKRNVFLPRLSDNINFHLMDISFLGETVKNEMYLDSETCRTKVDAAIALIKNNNEDDILKLRTCRQVSDANDEPGNV